MTATTMIASESAETDPAATAQDGSGSPWWTWLAQVGTSALILGFALNQRYGYAAGDYDHLVLSPVGMQWAKPELFANDWAVSSAPQPHWFFDFVTAMGTKAGLLPAVYLLYFALAMLAFGFATTMLARKWTPEHSWMAVLTVTGLSAVTPLYLLGSGAILWPVALPGVLGGLLIYVVCAAILVGRDRLAAGATVAVAMIHVQAGVIVVVLLGAVAAVTFLRTRRINYSLIIGSVVGLVIAVVALKIRPVAGNISDFARICDEIIPYHCNASVWPRKELMSGVAVVALALLTYFYARRDAALRWAVLLLLPATGLFIGLFLDLFNIPVLGPLAQGVNVYRLAVVFIPFLAWGILVPFLAKVGPRLRWALLAVVFVLFFITLRAETWGLTARVIKNDHWFFGLIMALVAGCVALTVPNIANRPETIRRVAAGLLLAACFSAGYEGLSQLSLRPLEPGMMQQRPLLVAWGEQMRQVVPVGSTIVMPPTFLEARMMSQRAIVADCKYAPYGGAAFVEYQRRMNQLGGLDQCGDPGKRGYSALSTDQLEAIAKEYGAKFIALNLDQGWAEYELRKRGWTLIVPATPYDPSDPEKDRIEVNVWKAPGA